MFGSHERPAPMPSMFGLIEPICPKTGNGRRPCPLDTMLRMQQWYNPCDAVNQWLFKAGIMMKQGMLVDATIINGPWLHQKQAQRE
jgi:hypothetical protein